MTPRATSIRNSKETAARRVMPRKAEEATEDYLEMINLLVAEKGFASTSDIAERMGVSQPTVTNILKKLDKQGYITYERYRGMALTEAGKNVARKMKDRHQTLVSLLVLIGVPEKIAIEDAEKIEHGLHEQTVRKLQELIEQLKKAS
jgi:Mn-dependent DtxR family transcriptional regulator